MQKFVIFEIVELNLRPHILHIVCVDALMPVVAQSVDHEISVWGDCCSGDWQIERHLKCFIFAHVIPDIDDAVRADCDAVGLPSYLSDDLVDGDQNLAVGESGVVLLAFEADDGFCGFERALGVPGEFGEIGATVVGAHTVGGLVGEHVHAGDVGFQRALGVEVFPYLSILYLAHFVDVDDQQFVAAQPGHQNRIFDVHAVHSLLQLKLEHLVILVQLVESYLLIVVAHHQHLQLADIRTTTHSPVHLSDLTHISRLQVPTHHAAVPQSQVHRTPFRLKAQAQARSLFRKLVTFSHLDHTPFHHHFVYADVPVPAAHSENTVVQKLNATHTVFRAPLSVHS